MPKAFGSFGPNFLDELRARTPLAALIGRSVRLTRSGREMKGCCPFHGEKTPSFYVYDDHFHCFGCGEHGDAITFVMKTTGAGFVEAVETLAAEAGLELPMASPLEAEAARERAGIAEVLEAAGKVFQNWLFEPQGAAALSYLRGRGLTDATIRKFGLGWSGEGRGVLAAAVGGQGISTEQLVEAGLMKLSDRGPVDMFFGRVMFPICDRRGQKISFGGRILGDGQPKYVNGPETAAFSKRRSLYGLHFAREAVRRGENLIVVEGYMDVIALSQAGFEGAVAPLGTALTEEHLAEIWRLSPEPVICFDADAAGRRAALKTVDLALTALAPDRSLKFLRLPEKEDPDSLVRREGPAGFRTRLAGAESLSSALYDMLADGIVTSSPEARADFRKRLTETANRIPDKILASEYRSMLLDRFFAARRKQPAGGGQKFLSYSARVVVRASAIVAPGRANQIRGFILTAILVLNPVMLFDLEESFATVTLPESCSRVRSGLLNFPPEPKDLDSDKVLTHLDGLGLAGEAKQILIIAKSNFPSMLKLAFNELVDAWWSLFNTMDEKRALLKQQSDESARSWIESDNDVDKGKRAVTSARLHYQAKIGGCGEEI